MTLLDKINVVSLNIFAVGIDGEAEFIFASIKLVAIVVLLLFALIIDPGGGPTYDPLGFRYWKHHGCHEAAPQYGQRWPSYILFNID